MSHMQPRLSPSCVRIEGTFGKLHHVSLLSVRQKIWDTSNSSDNLETDLGTWGPHQNSQSLPLFALGPEGPLTNSLQRRCGKQAAAGPASSSAD